MMRSIFIGSPPLKTVFSFLFSCDLIIRRKPENINGLFVFIFRIVFDTTKYPFHAAKAVIKDTLPSVSNRQEAGHGIPMSCFLSFLKGISSLRNHPYTLS